VLQPPREISVANLHPRLRVDRKAIARTIALLDAHASRVALQGRAVPPGDLSIALLTDGALAELHRDFLEDPATTDVITFEGDARLGTAGEICVSADAAAAYARQHRRPFAEELTLYLVHGWLHLAGYDDLVPAQKRAMRRAEARAIRLLRSQHAVPPFAWKSHATR
jgi:probable rRNA maturation factor